MAVKWNVDNTRGSVYYFDPATIVIRAELNGRHDLPDITDLKASILEHGQQQPCVVRNEDGRPVLIMGFSRWRAIVELNKERKGEDKIQLAAVYARCNEQDGYILNWEENRRRNATTPLDDAHQFAQLERWGWDKKKIAERLKVTPQFVSQRLALITAEPEVQEALSKGRIKTGAAVKIAKLAASEQRKAVAGNGHISKQAIAVATSTPIKPSFKSIREYVESHTGPGESKDVREFCEGLLKFMDGTVETQERTATAAG